MKSPSLFPKESFRDAVNRTFVYVSIDRNLGFLPAATFKWTLSYVLDEFQ